MSGTSLRFVHISDTHFGTTKDYLYHGRNSYNLAEKIIAKILELPVLPDFVIHTGDVATDKEGLSYDLACEVLKRIKCPVYSVPGNHDDVPSMRERFPISAKVNLLSGPDRLTYLFDIKGVRILVVDLHHEDDTDPSGYAYPAELDLLRKECAKGSSPLIVFSHFPILPIGAPWIDRNLLVQNGEEVHKILMSAGNRMRGFFSGHVHQNVQVVRDGILYSTVGSTCFQFGGWGCDEMITYQLDSPPTFNFVEVTGASTIVHQYVIDEWE